MEVLNTTNKFLTQEDNPTDEFLRNIKEKKYGFEHNMDQRRSLHEATDISLRMSQGPEMRGALNGEEPTNAFIKSLNYKMF